MIKSEAAFWKHLRDNNIPKTAKTHYSRVESHATSTGIPDVDFCHDGFSFYLELKHSDGKDFELRPAQHRWIQDRFKAGFFNVWILALHQPTETVLLIHGHLSRMLIEHPRVCDWNKVACASWPLRDFTFKDMVHKMKELEAAWVPTQE